MRSSVREFFCKETWIIRLLYTLCLHYPNIRLGPGWVPGGFQLGPGWVLVGPQRKGNPIKYNMVNRHRPQIRQIKPVGPAAPIWDNLGDFVALHFSSNFMIQGNLFNYNMYNAKCLFWLLGASQNPSKNHVFSKRLPNLFSNFMLLSC